MRRGCKEKERGGYGGIVRIYPYTKRQTDSEPVREATERMLGVGIEYKIRVLLPKYNIQITHSLCPSC